MLKLNKYNLTLFLILSLALFLRLRGFASHILIGSDTARDLLVARGALALQQLPSVGSFSSAGPFVFGPNWYWFLMLPTALFPNFFFAPWILLLLISLFTVLTMVWTGRLIGSKKLGLLVGFLVSVSPIAIGYSTYLTQHGLVEIFSALAVLGFVGFLKTKKMRFASLMALSIGSGLSLHYQAVNLIIFLPIAFLVDLMSQKSFKRLLILSAVLLAGVLIPLLPLIIWDSLRGFKNFLHIIGYFRVGQYQVYVPNRWLTYAGVFWPNFLGKVFGGSEVLGGATGIIVIMTSLYVFLKRKMPKEIFWLLIVFCLQFIIFRYFRGERYEGYVVYFHGILFLMVGWVVHQMVKFNLPATFAILVVSTYLGLSSMIPSLNWNNDLDKMSALKDSLKPLASSKKFDVLTYHIDNSNCGFAFSLVLDASGLEDDRGYPIGICKTNNRYCITPKEKSLGSVNFQGDRCVVVDLKNFPKISLTEEQGWYKFSKEAVFKDVQNWWLAE